MDWEVRRLDRSPPAPAASSEWHVQELLPDPRPGLDRALSLVDGRAYAATWVLTRLRRELPLPPPRSRALPPPSGVDQLRPPEPTTEPDRVVQTRLARRLLVLRDDGVAFGDPPF